MLGKSFGHRIELLVVFPSCGYLLLCSAVGDSYKLYPPLHSFLYHPLTYTLALALSLPWYVAIICSLRQHSRSQRPRLVPAAIRYFLLFIGSTLAIGFFALALSWSIIQIANGYFDYGAITERTFLINNKRAMTAKSLASFSVLASDDKSSGHSREFEVTRPDFEKAIPGQSMLVLYLKPGLFGNEWIHKVEIR